MVCPAAPCDAPLSRVPPPMFGSARFGATLRRRAVISAPLCALPRCSAVPFSARLGSLGSAQLASALSCAAVLCSSRICSPVPPPLFESARLCAALRRRAVISAPLCDLPRCSAVPFSARLGSAQLSSPLLRLCFALSYVALTPLCSDLLPACATLMGS